MVVKTRRGKYGTPPTLAKFARSANVIVKRRAVKACFTFDVGLVVSRGAFRYVVATDKRETESCL